MGTADGVLVVLEFPGSSVEFGLTINNSLVLYLILARRGVVQQGLQMFTFNNLSIIDETGRSDVMAAPIPSANKWVLTKQASVAQRTSDDRREMARGQRQGKHGRSFSASVVEGTAPTHKQMQEADPGPRERLLEYKERKMKASRDGDKEEGPGTRPGWVSAEA